MSNIQSMVHDIIREAVTPPVHGAAPEFDDSTPLATGTLHADSLDLIEITMACEEQFSIEISDDDVDGWETVGDIVATVRKLTP